MVWDVMIFLLQAGVAFIVATALLDAPQ